MKKLDEKQDTIRELRSHAQHLVVALENKDYARASFHADNAQGCLNWLKRLIQIEEVRS